MKCVNCNAGLSADHMRGQDCPFCGTALPHQAQAIEATATIKELLRDEDGDGIPDIVGGLRRSTQHSEARSTESSRPASGFRRWIRVSVSFLLFTAFVVYVLAYSPGDPLGLGARDLATFTQFCLVDVNGDTTGDVVAYAPGQEDLGARLVFLDGRDGTILWKSERKIGANRLECLGEDRVLLSFGDFHSEFYAVSSPQESLSLSHGDNLHSFGYEKDCLTIKSDDEGLRSFSLPSGASSDCRVRDLTRRGTRPKNFLGSLNKTASSELGGSTVTLRQRAKGSPVLTVGLRSETERSWTTPLAFVAPHSASAIALTPTRALVWAAAPGKPNDVSLVALDRSTGGQVQAIRFPQPGAAMLHFFTWNGEHLMIGFMGGLHAVDPVNGETVWDKGATGMGRTVTLGNGQR
jgi:hypothetical protein